jgi:hypothetical protein
MRARWLPILPILHGLGPLLLVGCLQEGRPVVGRPLVKGRAVENPTFVKDGTWLTYQVRRRPAEAALSGAFDYAMVSYDTAEVRPLVENVADRWGVVDDGAGLTFVMADEAMAPDQTSTTASLVLLDLDRGEVDRIPTVTSYFASTGTREFYYRQAVPGGGRQTALHYRSAAGMDRPLGISSGRAELKGGRFYFVGEPGDPAAQSRTLSRFVRPDGPIEAVRAKVTDFSINADESWAILNTSDAGKAEIVARQLDTGAEHRVPASQSAYWMGVSATEFVYSEPAVDGAPAQIHRHQLATGKETVAAAPPGLINVRDVRQRPGSSDRLYSDSRGQLAVVPAGAADGHLIGGSPLQLTVTDDGKFAVWIDLLMAMPPQGRVMIQDLDFREPARQLSPKGALIAPEFRFLRDLDRSILVFWGQFGNNGADLYYADPATGSQRVVAEGIAGKVIILPYQVIGIVRVSEQDLVGDLVNKDLALNTEIPLAHAVAEDVIYGDKVVFVIRDRVSSDRDGLWAIGIDGTPPGAATAGP